MCTSIADRFDIFEQTKDMPSSNNLHTYVSAM